MPCILEYHAVAKVVPLADELDDGVALFDLQLQWQHAGSCGGSWSGTVDPHLKRRVADALRRVDRVADMPFKHCFVALLPPFPVHASGQYRGDQAATRRQRGSRAPSGRESARARRRGD